MKLLILFAAVTIIGCVNNSELKPIASKLDAPYVRVITTKDDILYNYKLREEGPNGFELAEADAIKICRSRWQLQAILKTQVSCASHNNSATICATTFMCQ